MDRPLFELARNDGSVARFYATEERHRYRVEIDDQPFDMMNAVDRVRSPDANQS